MTSDLSTELKYAAVDIGSNAVRLLIGTVIERDDHPIIKKTSLVRVPVRLGQDVFHDGEITVARRDHLIKSLKAFRLLTEVHQVRKFRICATSAMREATNREAILSEVEMRSGTHIEIIEGDSEAEMIVSTFWTGDMAMNEPYLYIDVGGGSTEITRLENGERVAARSFKIGTLRILQDKVDPSEWERLDDWLNTIRAKHGKLMAIGTGGNINRLFKENLNQYGVPLHRDDIQKHRDRIGSYSLEDRIKYLRLRPDRADVIIPAADIYLRALDKAGIDEVYVPKVGLADGIIYDLYLKDRGAERYPHLVASGHVSN